MNREHREENLGQRCFWRCWLFFAIRRRRRKRFATAAAAARAYAKTHSGSRSQG